MISHKIIKMVSAILLVLIFCVFVQADKKIVERIELVISSGESISRTAEVTTWIGSRKFARVDNLNDITTIVDIDIGKIYILLHASQEAVEMEIPFDLPAELEPLFKDVTMDWTINRLPENQMIGQWNCSKVILTGRGALKIDMELWVTDDVEIDTRAFHSMVGETLRASPIYREMGEKLIGIFPSYSIRTKTTIEQLGFKTETVSEVRSIEDAIPPVGIYAPPEGYTVKPLEFSTYLSLIRERQPEPSGN